MAEPRLTRLSYRLLLDAAGFRHGIVAPVEEAVATFADIDGIANVNIPGEGRADEAAGGGVARDREEATVRAIGEALERYAAAIASLPLRTISELRGAEVLGADEFALFSEEQRRAPSFPWPSPSNSDVYTNVYCLFDNREVWVPHELVSLGSRVEHATFPSTSSGLAAHKSPWLALLSALEELLERDALTVAWHNALGGHEVVLDDAWRAPVLARGGEVECFELTQAWNPHPVIVVCGQIPLRGRKRFALGAACRATREAATEKAWLEFLQGVIFAGFYANARPDLSLASGRDVREFPEHCVYYMLRPEEWDALPLRRRRVRARPARVEPAPESPEARLERLVRALHHAGIRAFYRDLTTVDVASLGITVVRAVSPELSLLHGDERYPFLGGRTRDIAWRWPNAAASDLPFPNPYPHPLG
ncbi:MAG TPA: YcaO-like family protein [Labilithrix sp.]|jgi:ribosomal protein S12 methylthiotransferase accessory factor|nr:YcaO-like family protein [Labilithrix sp.]